jgi:hypothetical protein
MKKINSANLTKIKGGDAIDRIAKQLSKCATGKTRSCRRAMRMSARHLYKMK